MPLSPPPETHDALPMWMFAGMFAVAAITHILKLVARGEQFARATIARQLAEACLTGVTACGLWSALREFTELKSTAGVAIAAFVGVLGVRYVTGLAARWLDEKAGGSSAPRETEEMP